MGNIKKIMGISKKRLPTGTAFDRKSGGAYIMGIPPPIPLPIPLPILLPIPPPILWARLWAWALLALHVRKP